METPCQGECWSRPFLTTRSLEQRARGGLQPHPCPQLPVLHPVITARASPTPVQAASPGRA